MELINKIKRQEVKVPYYDDNYRLNKSKLDIFERSPAEYKRQLDSPIELDSPALRRGTMIHKYILEHNDFWNEYFLSREQQPNKSTNQRQFAYKLVELKYDGSGDVAARAYKESYSTKSIGTDEFNKKLTEAVKDVEGWVNEQLSNPDKLPISSYDLDDLQSYVESIRRHSKANDLLYRGSIYVQDEDGNLEEQEFVEFSEFHINWKHKTGIDCKSLIDKVIFLPKERIAYLVDLKTTSDIPNFKDSYNKYRYGMQMAFYKMALGWYIENILGENPDEWSIEPYIVAVQKDTSDVSVFMVSEDELEYQAAIIERLMEELVWHNEKQIWNMTKRAYELGGVELI